MIKYCFSFSGFKELATFLEFLPVVELTLVDVPMALVLFWEEPLMVERLGD